MYLTKDTIIAVDFDGTIVEWAFPYIGKAVPLALETLHDLQTIGCKLILWTVRTNEHLKQAYDYCTGCYLSLWGVNENPGQKYWSSSPKVHADIFIDDAALGCPLVYPPNERAYVDWRIIRKQLGLSKI